jgi:tetratricopeptide (TPR) repeat protein
VAWCLRRQMNRAKPEELVAAMYDLAELDEAEQVLLANLAVLPPESLPYEVLQTLLPHLADLPDTLPLLAQKGWVQRNGHNYRSSPVMQAAVRHHRQAQLWADCQPLTIKLQDVLNWQENPDYHEDNYRLTRLYTRGAESLLLAFPDLAEDALGVLHERVGYFYQTQGDLVQALGHYQKYQELTADLHARYPDAVDYQNGLAISHQNLGEAHAALGDLGRALGHYQQYQELEADLHARYPANVGYQNNLAISHSKLGETHADLGDLARALGHYQQYHELAADLHARYPDAVDYQNNLAISYLVLGQFYQIHQNDPAQAKTHYQQARPLLADLVQKSGVVDFQNNLAWVEDRLRELG